MEDHQLVVRDRDRRQDGPDDEVAGLGRWPCPFRRLFRKSAEFVEELGGALAEEAASLDDKGDELEAAPLGVDYLVPLQRLSPLRGSRSGALLEVAVVRDVVGPALIGNSHVDNVRLSPPGE